MSFQVTYKGLFHGVMSVTSEVALNPVSQNLLIDFSPVTFTTTSVTSKAVEERTGKMATANKLTVLRKIKQEKVFFSGHFK